MLPLASMDNFASILFPEGAAAPTGGETARPSSELIGELIASLEEIAGRKLSDSEIIDAVDADEFAEFFADLCPEPSPLESVEDNPTWFIEKFDEDQREAAYRAKLDRHIERHKARLARKVARALGVERPPVEKATEPASCPKQFDRLDLGSALAIADGLPAHPRAACRFFYVGFVNLDEEVAAILGEPCFIVEQSSLLRWLLGIITAWATPYRSAHLPARVLHERGLDHLAEAIERVGNARVRASLRRDLRHLRTLIEGDPVDLRAVSFEPDGSPRALVHAAGGRTDRYVPRD